MKAIYSRLQISNIKLRSFLLNAQEAFKMGDISAADELIIDREINHKDRSRAKVLRAGEYPEQEWIGIDKLDYRFTPAKRIIQDIMNAGVE